MKEVLVSRLQTLTVQDITLFVLCAVAIYLLRVQDIIVLQPQWRRDFDTTSYDNKIFPSKDELLPRPIITDLESDNINEVVLITNELRLEVLALPNAQEVGILPHLEVKSSIQLPTNGEEDGRNNRPIAMDTGYLQKYESIVQIRKQVIVIILDNWNVLCYNHQLELLWQQQMMDIGQIREDYTIKSMGILISPESLVRAEEGVIIVGGSFVHKAHTHRKKKIGSDDYNKPGIVEDEKGRKVRNTPIHYIPKRDNSPEGDTHAVSEEEVFTHFSTFALSGVNGTIRWHHLPGDFESQPKVKHEPHHWKLALKKHNAHEGEVSWEKFTQGLFKQMPYAWSGLQDTRFELAQLHRNTEPKMAGIKVPEQTQESSTVPDILGLPTEHLTGYAYGGMRPHSRHEHVENPNTVIIHNHMGIEVLGLTSGRPLTHLHVDEEKVAYADVNMDGNLDRVNLNVKDGKCEAEVTSLPPELKVLYSGVLCEAPSWWGELSLSAAFFPEPEVKEDTKVAVLPTVVKSVASRSGPFQHLLGHSLPSLRRGYDSIYITSTGRLTSYGPDGQYNWQVRTPAQWAEVAQMAQAGHSSSSQMVQVFNSVFKPSVTAFSKQIYGKQTVALLLGWDNSAVVDLRDGRLLTEHSLPCQPITSPIIGDFNNDGLNDFIISCPSGYLGFSLHSQPNYMYMAAVAVGVILAMLSLTWCFKPDDVLERDW